MSARDLMLSWLPKAAALYAIHGVARCAWLTLDGCAYLASTVSGEECFARYHFENRTHPGMVVSCLSCCGMGRDFGGRSLAAMDDCSVCSGTGSRVATATEIARKLLENE